MDKKLLDALNNIGNALTELTDALKSGDSSKSNNIEDILKSGNFGNQLESINTELKSIRINTEEILKNQDTIMSLTKENSNQIKENLVSSKSSSGQETITSISKEKSADSENPVENAGSKSQIDNIKKGVGSILLIAGAVLAIGMAFKIIGDVNFASVVSIALAIGIISLAFKNISDTGMTVEAAKNTSFIMVLIAGAISASSLLLSLVSPVSPVQIATSLAIGGMFALIINPISKAINSTNISDASNIFASSGYLFLVLVTASAGIMLSSYLLSKVTPVEASKLITAVLISASMSSVIYYMSKMANSIGGVSPLKLLASSFIISAVLPIFTLGLVSASYNLSMINPIGASQLITAVLLSATIIPISYAIKEISSAISGINPVGLQLAGVFLATYLPIMALSIVDTSLILNSVVPIGFQSLLTSILISGLFVALSLSAKNIFKTLQGMDPKAIAASAVMVPVLFTAMSLAVLGASYILSEVKPVSFTQILTAIGVSATFIPLAYSVAAILKVTGNIDPSNLYKLPILFVAMSVSILLSSLALSQMPEMQPSLVFQALLLGSTLAAISLVMLPVISAYKNVNYSDMVKGAAVIIGIATTISISSIILSVGSYNDYPGIGWVLGTSLSLVTFGFAIYGVSKMIDEIGTESLLKGVVAVIGIATTISLSSMILSVGNYGNYPGIGWILGTSLSLVTFGLAAIALGGIMKLTGAQGALYMAAGLAAILAVAVTVVATSAILGVGNYGNYPGIGWILGTSLSLVTFGLAAISLGGVIFLTGGQGALYMAAGLVAILAVATAILATSAILGAGNYGNYPGIGWSLGVSMSLFGFGITSLALGAAIVATYGSGALAILAGLASMLAIAGTVVAVDKILSSGNYGSYPTEEWASGVSLAMTTFGMSAIVIGGLIVGTLGGGALLFRIGRNAMLTTAEAIVSISEILSNGKYNVPGFVEWSKSVSSLFESFIPIMSRLGRFIFTSSISKFLGLGDSWAKMRLAVLDTGKLIVDLSTIMSLGSYSSSFPTEQWSSGIGKSLEAFMPSFKMMIDSKSLFSVGLSQEEIISGIMSISSAILTAGKMFSEGEGYFESGYPKKEWGEGVGLAIGSFLPVFKMMIDNKGLFSTGLNQYEIRSGIRMLSSGLVVAANSFNENPGVFTDNYPTESWSKGVGAAISGFMPVFKMMINDKNLFSLGLDNKEIESAISTISLAIVTAAIEFNKNPGFFTNNYPTEEWGKGVGAAISGFMPVIKFLSDNKSFFSSGLDEDEMDSVIKSISKSIIASGEIFNNMDGKVNFNSNYPSESWGKGIGAAIMAFVPVYDMVMEGKKIFSKSLDLNEITNIIESISKSIASAGKSLGENVKSNYFDIYPSKEWANGIGAAIKAFSPVYEMIMENKEWFSSSLSLIEITNVVKSISDSISIAGKYLSADKVNFGIYPSESWGEGVSAAINAFSPVYGMIMKNKEWFSSSLGLSEINSVIKSISDSISIAGKYLSADKVNFGIYPSESWGTGVSAAINAFSPVYGMIMKNKEWFSSSLSLIEIKNVVKSISDSISIASKYLSADKVNFGIYPSESWGAGVSAAINAFSPVYGMIMKNKEWFSNSLDLNEINSVIQSISNSIAIAGKYLSAKAKLDYFSIYPSESWGAGVSAAINAFSPVYGMIMKNKEWFSSSLGLNEINSVIQSISNSIAIAGKYLSAEAKLDYFSIYPKEEWAKGVGLAINAFSPVYGMIMKNKEWFSNSLDLDEITSVIKGISDSIIVAGKYLSAEAKADYFSVYPSENWGRGVGSAINAFSPVYEMIMKNKEWFSNSLDLDEITNVIKTISNSIVVAGKSLSADADSNYFSVYPSEEWAKGVGLAISAFSPVYKMILDSKSIFSNKLDLDEVSLAIKKIAIGIADAGKAINGNEIGPIFSLATGILDFTKISNEIEKESMFFGSGIKRKINDIIYIAKQIEKNKDAISNVSDLDAIIKLFSESGVFGQFINLIERSKELDKIDDSRLVDISFSLLRLGRILDSGREYFNYYIDPNYIGSISKNIIDFSNLIKEITAMNLDEFFGGSGFMDRLFGNDPISRMASGMIKLAKGYDALSNSLDKLSRSISSININEIRELNNISREIVVPIMSEKGESINNITTIKEEGPSVKDKEINKGVGGIFNKNEEETLEKKLDKVIELLSNLNSSASSIDTTVKDSLVDDDPRKGFFGFGL